MDEAACQKYKEDLLEYLERSKMRNWTYIGKKHVVFFDWLYAKGKEGFFLGQFWDFLKDVVLVGTFDKVDEKDEAHCRRNYLDKFIKAEFIEKVPPDPGKSDSRRWRARLPWGDEVVVGKGKRSSKRVSGSEGRDSSGDVLIARLKEFAERFPVASVFSGTLATFSWKLQEDLESSGVGGQYYVLDQGESFFKQELLGEVMRTGLLVLDFFPFNRQAYELLGRSVLWVGEIDSGMLCFDRVVEYTFDHKKMDSWLAFTDRLIRKGECSAALCAAQNVFSTMYVGFEDVRLRDYYGFVIDHMESWSLVGEFRDWFWDRFPPSLDGLWAVVPLIECDQWHVDNLMVVAEDMMRFDGWRGLVDPRLEGFLESLDERFWKDVLFASRFLDPGFPPERLWALENLNWDEHRLHCLCLGLQWYSLEYYKNSCRCFYRYFAARVELYRECGDYREMLHDALKRWGDVVSKEREDLLESSKMPKVYGDAFVRDAENILKEYEKWVGIIERLDSQL